MNEVEYWTTVLSTLKGGKILEAVVDYPEEEGDEPYFGLLIEMPDKTSKILWLLSDEEGNHGGRCNVEPARLRGRHT